MSNLKQFTKTPEFFFGDPLLSQVDADKEAIKQVRNFQKPNNFFPGDLSANLSRTLSKKFLQSYDEWNKGRGVAPFSSMREANQKFRSENYAKNLPVWQNLFSDEKFEQALDRRGLKTGYQKVVNTIGESDSLKNKFREKMFLQDLAGSRDDLTKARVAKDVLKHKDHPEKSFIDLAKQWVVKQNEKVELGKNAYKMGIDAFIADDGKSFLDGLKKVREAGPSAESAFHNAYYEMREGNGKAMLFQVNKLVAKAKSEGERGLFEQKKDLPEASIGLIAEFYAKPGGREKFLMILNNKIEQESSKTDVSFFTKFLKQASRFYESEIGAAGRNILRRNIEESDRSLFFPDDPDSKNFETVNGRKVAKKLSEQEKAYFRNVQQVSADISNVKQAVSQIDGENWFSTMILDQSGTLAQMPLIMNPVGFYTRYDSQRQLDTEEMLSQNPNLSYEEARGMARFSAGMNVFSERLATGFFLKKFPTIKNVTSKIKGANPVSVAQAFRRAGVAAAGITGAEYLQESFQEATLPLTLDLFSALKEDMPYGNWDQFKMWDQRRFLAVLPLAILGGGGQSARDTISTAELGKVLLAKNDVMISGRSEKQAQEVAELAMTDPDAALALYKKQGESMSKEEQEAFGNEAMRNVYSDQLGEEFAAMPIARQTEDGKFSLDFQDGRKEEYDSVAERDQALENWSKEEFFQTREAMEAFAKMAKERVEGEADFKIERPRTFQDLADQGVETEANLKKAIGVYYSQMGEVAPDKIDLANYIEEGSVSLKRNLSGFAVRLAQGASPITVAEEFSEGFIRRAVGLNETSFDEVKALLDEFGEMSGIQMTEGYDIDPERAVIEGFSKFSKAYALQGKYDMLPKETQSWMSKAWAVMENSNNIPGVLKAFSELFSKMFKAVYDVAKAIEFHRAKGAGIDPDLESMALRALGFDQKDYDQRMREKSQQEIIEEVYGPDFSIREDRAEAGKEQVGEDGITEVVTPDESTVPGTLAPTRPVEEIIPDENAPEIPWDMSTFGIAPKTDDKSFPLLNEKLSKQLLEETDVVGAIHIDRAGIGEIDGIPIQGGARFPSIKENLEKGIAWAFNSVSVASDVLTRSREANGYIKLILMSEGNVVGNKTFATIWLNRVGKIVKDKTVLDAVLTEFHKIRKSAIKSKITNKRREEAKKVKEGKKVTPTPEENIAKYDRKGESVETFAQLKKFLLKMPQSNRASYYFKRQTQSEDTSNRKKGQTVYGKLLGEKFSKKYGLPDASELVGKMEDPSFKGMKIGDVVALIKIDPDSEVMTAKEAGVPEHLSYGYVVKGKPFARMKKIRNVDEDYPSIKGKIMSQGSKQYPAKDYASFSIGRSEVTPTADTQTFPTKDGGVVGPASFSISAFHGTPHKVDKFSTEQIGTGEGAQAYGWGLYFAQDKDVAQQYRIALAYDPDKQRINGRQINDEYSRYNTATATSVDYQILEGLERLMMHDSPAEVIEMFEEQGYSQKAISYFKDSKYETFGGLYTVELNVEQDELLDWNKPISEQSESIRSKMLTILQGDASMFLDVREAANRLKQGEYLDGRQAYIQLQSTIGAKRASEALTVEGIKGIRYLDGNSRADGEGTSNYVIFNDVDITITEENGQVVDTTSPSFSITPAEDAKGYDALLRDVSNATKQWSSLNQAYESAETQSEIQEGVGFQLEREGVDLNTEEGSRRLDEAIAAIDYDSTKEGILDKLQYAKDEAESGVQGALERFLEPMGYEVEAVSTGSPSSFYFEIAPDFDTQEWLEENLPDFEIEEAKGKIRFSDHSKTSSRYDAPDVNIQPGESIETQFNNLFNRLPNLTAMQDTFAIQPVEQYGAITKLEKKILSDRVNIGKRLEAKLEADEENWNNAKKSGNQEEIERTAQQVMRRTQAYMEVLPDYPMGPTISKAQDLAEKVLVGSIEITEGIKIVDENARYSGLPIKLPPWLSNLKVADWVKRNLRARGDLTPDQFKIKLASEAITLTELKRAELINSRLKKAVKKEALVAPNSEGVLMEDFLMKRVQDALVMDGAVNVTEAINKLPKSLQSVTKEMRVHVDSLSREMIKKGIAKGDLADVFQRNIGSYLNRSYRRFTRPEKWKHEVSEESKKNAMQWLEDNLPAEAFSGDVSKEDQLEGYVDTLLTDSVSGGFTDQMNWLLGQKHIGNLIARKKVPIELRELWGEYKRGDENYMTSVRKMATQIGNHTMLTEFLKNGLNTEIFSTPRKGFSKQISSKGNEMLSPLDGYYVSEGMSQALIDFSETGEKTAWWLKYWLKYNSLSKVSKTIYNPTTHARNFLSNFVYVGANGNLFEYLNIDTVKMSATINYKEIFKSWGTTKDIEDRILHYIRLGIMQQGAVSQEFKDILNDFSAGDVDIDEYTQNSVKRFAKAGLKKIESLYQAEDDFHKIVSYEAERAKLAKAKPEWKSDKLDAEAAQIVRDTMPDYSQVPHAVKMLRRLPFIGTFTSFTSEVIRNNTNIIQRAKFEMSDPELRSIGAKRLSSFAIAHSIPLAGAYYLASLLGVDDEEDEATRAIAAPWDKYAQLLYVGRTPSGDPQYINISYTDPFSVFKTPIFVSQQDGFSPVSVGKGILMGLEPFYGEEIGTAALLDIRENKNEKIYNPNSDAWTITKDISEHILKALEPGLVRSTKRIYEAATGKETDSGMKLDTRTEVIAVLSGQRITSIDRRRAIFHRNNDFQDALRSSTYRFKRAWRNKNVDKKELSKAYKQYKKDNEKAYSEFQDALQAVSRLGLTEEQILLETTKGKDNTETAKRLLNLLRAPAGETPMPDKKFTKSQIKEIEEKGRKEILEEVAPELFD